MKSYKTFISVDRDGSITGRLLCLAEEGEIPDRTKPIEIKTDAERIMIRRDPDRYYWNKKRQKILPKPEMTIIPSKTIFSADGNDSVEVKFGGRIKKNTKVHVGGQLFTVNQGDTVEVASTKDRLIHIVCTDRRIWARPVSLHSKKERPE